MRKLVLLISETEDYCWTKEMSSCFNVDREENSNYPDWEPPKPRFPYNYKDNDEDLLEISNDQFSSWYHQGGEI